MLHVHLHGCGLSARLATHNEKMRRFNEYAVANDIIVLYPDAQLSFFNLIGCWDIMSYSGNNYLTKDSVQARYL